MSDSERSMPLPERSIKRPIADEVFFQKQDHVAFSPAMQETLSLENLMLAILVVKLSRTAEGTKHLKDIIIKYLDSCARIVESVEEACHSNWLTALNNQHIAASISHRIGLIDDGSYIKIMEHYRSVFDKMLVQKYFLDGITTLVQGSKTVAAKGAKEPTAFGSIVKALVATKGIKT